MREVAIEVLERDFELLIQSQKNLGRPAKTAVFILLDKDDMLSVKTHGINLLREKDRAKLTSMIKQTNAIYERKGVRK